MVISVRVPATTANLGPGFDCLGLALGLYNTFHFQPATHFSLQISGVSGLTATVDNLAYRSFTHLFRMKGEPVPTVQLHIEVGVPLSRGLGSSATAIVGGLVAANQWLGQPLTTLQLLEEATKLEGHPDNVAPALLGGCQLSVMTGEQVLNVPIPWPMALIPLVIIPDFTLSTAKARAVLPSLTPRGDAIFNTTRLGLLVLALMQNRPEWLAHALQDRLHQPYRLPLVPGMSDVAEAGITAGAYGVVLSGAGPTLLALCSEQTTAAVAEMMQSTWDALGIRAHTRVLSVDIQGAVLL